MADEARLNDLLDLVEQARAEGDKDTEAKAIAAYKRESAPQIPKMDYSGFQPPQIPMIPVIGSPMNMANAFDRLNSAAGVTAEAKPSDVATMIPETAMQMGSGLAGSAVGGVAGIGQGLWNQTAGRLSPDLKGPEAADRVRQVQQAMTYQPRTAGGQALSATTALPFEAYGKATNWVGEKATDVTGSPLVGTFFKTLGDIAPGLIGAKGLPKRGSKPNEQYTPTKFDVPTTEQLKKATSEAYDANKDSGIIVTPVDYDKALAGVRDMVQKEGIDPTLHPKTTAVMKRLEGAAGKPLTLQEAETLRKIALDAEDDLNPVTRQPTPDARLAGKVVDELDDRIDALSTNDAARALNRRKKNSEMIDRMIARAELKGNAQYTQAGMEHALRQEFKQLALNDRRMRFLSAEQKAAVKKVAMGGPLENTLRALGKFDPTSSVVSAAGSIATGGMLSPLTGGASLGLPLLGILGRRAATKMTERNVNAAREALVGRGVPSSLPPTQQKAPSSPIFDSLPFTMTPGVLPSRTGILSRGLELEQPPVQNPAVLPPIPSRMTADTPPPPVTGGLDFKPTFMGNDLAGSLALETPQPKYPGGLDFSPTDLSRNYAEQISGTIPGLFGRETPATPATVQRGLLDLPQKPRPKKDVLSDIRRLEAQIRGLSKEQQADGTTLAGLSQEWQRLHAELASRESREASK